MDVMGQRDRRVCQRQISPAGLIVCGVVWFCAATVWAKQRQLIFNVIESFSQVIFGIINMIMRPAPIGAFGAMAFTIGKYGVGSGATGAVLIIRPISPVLLFVVVVLGTIARVTALAFLNLFAISGKNYFYCVWHLLFRVKRCRVCSIRWKTWGAVSRWWAGDPDGYSFNLDGTSIYLTMAAVFIARATNSHMDIFHQITLLVAVTRQKALRRDRKRLIKSWYTISAVGHLPLRDWR